MTMIILILLGVYKSFINLDDDDVLWDSYFQKKKKNPFNPNLMSICYQLTK